VITWNEIKALEDACLQIKYVLNTSECPNVKYSIINIIIDFSKTQTLILKRKYMLGNVPEKGKLLVDGRFQVANKEAVSLFPILVAAKLTRRRDFGN